MYSGSKQLPASSKCLWGCWLSPSPPKKQAKWKIDFLKLRRLSQAVYELRLKGREMTDQRLFKEVTEWSHSWRGTLFLRVLLGWLRGRRWMMMLDGDLMWKWVGYPFPSTLQRRGQSTDAMGLLIMAFEMWRRPQMASPWGQTFCWAPCLSLMFSILVGIQLLFSSAHRALAIRRAIAPHIWRALDWRRLLYNFHPLWQQDH